MFRLLGILAFMGLPVWASLTAGAPGTVQDSQGITWLQNADLAANPAFRFGVSPCSTTVTSDCINSDGSMDYQAATDWIKNMNSASYLGHNNWQLPTTPNTDLGCTGLGAQNNGFAFGCSGSALGSLYYLGLGLKAASSAIGTVTNSVGPFTNLQPNLYWTGQVAPGGGAAKGYLTFSFANGWSGSNVGDNDVQNGIAKHVGGNFLSVLPMIPGSPVAGGGALRLNPDGTVFDPNTGATWSANANPAATFAANPALLQSIGMQLCIGVGSIGAPNPAPCMNSDGSMNHASAVAFVNGLNAIQYLNHVGWELPPNPVDAQGNPLCSGFGCSSANDPLGSLFYNSLGLSQGQTVYQSTANAGLFSNVQPYLYWACPAAIVESDEALSPCSKDPQCTPQMNPGTCGSVMDWSFDLGNGFQGTDLQGNDLFVTAYYVDTPEPKTGGLFGFGAFATLLLIRLRYHSRQTTVGA